MQTQNSQSLLQEQRRLHEQADKMMLATKIVELFSKFGEFMPVGGSYAYELMAWPDLDFSVIVDDMSRQKWGSILSALTANSYIRKINSVDNVHFTMRLPGKPVGYWVGLEIPFENDAWNIDCWFMSQRVVESTQDVYGERLKILDEAGRRAVLLVKHELRQRGVYGRAFSSADVYDAVLDNDVRSVEAFDALHLK